MLLLVVGLALFFVIHLVPTAPELRRGLSDRFGSVVDGVRAAAEHLPGKPRPDTYLQAAADLGVPAERAVVIEDAVSGVAAGMAAAAVIGRFQIPSA